MSRRSFLFGTLVMLAGLAAATPARAGSVITTSISFSNASPALTEIDLTYSGAGTLSNLTPTSGPGGAALTLSGDVVSIKWSPAFAGPFSLVFTMDSTTNSGATATPTFTPSGDNLTNFNFHVSQGSVPEPATLALLGIGMTGLLAFRRFFKKTSVA
jgi:hypothetical protein